MPILDNFGVCKVEMKGEPMDGVPYNRERRSVFACTTLVARVTVFCPQKLFWNKRNKIVLKLFLHWQLDNLFLLHQSLELLGECEWYERMCLWGKGIKFEKYEMQLQDRHNNLCPFKQRILMQSSRGKSHTIWRYSALKTKKCTMPMHPIRWKHVCMKSKKWR